MQVLVDMINQSLGILEKDFLAISGREYGTIQSAGVTILEKSTGDEVLSMDIDIKPVVDSKYYYYGETSVKGVLANEILADKITACSGEAVYKWRTKDIVDVYALTHCIPVKIKEIYNICDRVQRELKSFDAFYQKRKETEHSYNKLKGIEGKPIFDDLYNYLSKFFKPFAMRDYSDKIWNHDAMTWDQLREATMNRIR